MPARAAKAVDDDEDFPLIQSAHQLGKPPELRKEEVKFPDWERADGGRGVKFLEWELTGGEWAEMVDSGWTYKDGRRDEYNSKDEDVRFLAHTTRDQRRTRIWLTVEDAKAALRDLGKADMKRLADAANKANSVKPGSAEKNSETTPSVS